MNVLLDVKHNLVELDCQKAQKNQKNVDHPILKQAEEHVWEGDPHSLSILIVHALYGEEEDEKPKAERNRVEYSKILSAADRSLFVLKHLENEHYDKQEDQVQNTDVFVEQDAGKEVAADLECWAYDVSSVV